MGKFVGQDRSVDVQQQIASVRRAKAALGDRTLDAVESTLAGVVRAQERRNASKTEILDLTKASVSEVRKARRRRSVRIGEAVFLPSWKDSAYGLPNALIRSSLFSAETATCAERKVAVLDLPISAHGDVVLKLTGLRLIDYDRQVFAAALSAYRGDAALSSGEGGAWLQLSFWQFAGLMGVSYGLKVHVAIRESLIRLNAAHLRLRANRRDVPLPRLIDVAFDDGYDELAADAKNLKGSDLILFRVPEGMAELFGPKTWTAVPDVALTEYSGLTRWLTTFYSTHADPYGMLVQDLYNHSGSNCGLREFRRRLKNALVQLEDPNTPYEIRVAATVYEKATNRAKDKVTVYLARWNQVDRLTK